MVYVPCPQVLMMKTGVVGLLVPCSISGLWFTSFIQKLYTFISNLHACIKLLAADVLLT